MNKDEFLKKLETELKRERATDSKPVAKKIVAPQKPERLQLLADRATNRSKPDGHHLHPLEVAKLEHRGQIPQKEIRRIAKKLGVDASKIRGRRKVLDHINNGQLAK